LAEYRITYYDGKIVRFSFRDYAEGGKISYKTMNVFAFIGRLIRHIPDKHFPMIRYAGLFCNRWQHRFLAQACLALGPENIGDQNEEAFPCWAERQRQDTGKDPLKCPRCDGPLEFIGIMFGNWIKIQLLFTRGQKEPTIPIVLRKTAQGP